MGFGMFARNACFLQATGVLNVSKIRMTLYSFP